MFGTRRGVTERVWCASSSGAAPEGAREPPRHVRLQQVRRLAGLVEAQGRPCQPRPAGRRRPRCHPEEARRGYGDAPGLFRRRGAAQRARVYQPQRAQGGSPGLRVRALRLAHLQEHSADESPAYCHAAQQAVGLLLAGVLPGLSSPLRRTVRRARLAGRRWAARGPRLCRRRLAELGGGAADRSAAGSPARPLRRPSRSASTDNRRPEDPPAAARRITTHGPGRGSRPSESAEVSRRWTNRGHAGRLSRASLAVVGGPPSPRRYSRAVGRRAYPLGIHEWPEPDADGAHMPPPAAPGTAAPPPAMSVPSSSSGAL